MGVKDFKVKEMYRYDVEPRKLTARDLVEIAVDSSEGGQLESLDERIDKLTKIVGKLLELHLDHGSLQPQDILTLLDLQYRYKLVWGDESSRDKG